jgi:CubicO group peptidase (beta-lactamase class C family)
LGWDITKVAALEEILESGNTRGFILLKDGKIVLEKYFGSTLAGNQNFNQNSLWYWASAGKVLTASLTGIAQEEGFLNLQQPSSTQLGLGWTSLSKEQEDKILIWHQLTMTSGLDDAVSNRDDFSPSNLVFQAAPGTRWAYHNAPYTLLEQVISSATDRDFNSYFNEKIASKIGMSGSWQRIGFNQVYFSNARSMARFGLMILAEGKWANEEIIKDRAFFDQMIQSSQLINPAYGYLWWLNGKSNFMLPVVQTVFSGSLIPDAPGDMIVAAGRDGQFLCVVPSENLVLVRMGLDADQSLVSFIYLNRIWKALGDLRR